MMKSAGKPVIKNYSGGYGLTASHTSMISLILITIYLVKSVRSECVRVTEESVWVCEGDGGECVSVWG